MRPAARSTAGVDHTAPPLLPGATAYVCQLTAPVASSTATTPPRSGPLGSPLVPEIPWYTTPLATAGEPYTSELVWASMTVSQRTLPVVASRSTSAGLDGRASGTITLVPST